LAWRWIYDCRFLPTDHLHLLLSGSAQQITRRRSGGSMGAMWIELEPATRMDFSLANKGADEVCVRYDRDRGRINFDKKNQELKDAFFRAHTLSIARFRVTLELALRMKASPEGRRVSGAVARTSAARSHGGIAGHGQAPASRRALVLCRR